MLKDKLIVELYGLIDTPNLLQQVIKTFEKMIKNQFLDDMESLSKEIALMAPHLGRVGELMNKMNALKQQNAHKSSILDSIPMGIVVLDQQGFVLQSNLRARKLFDRIGAKCEDSTLTFQQDEHQRAFKLAQHQVRQYETHAVPFEIGSLHLWLSRQGSVFNSSTVLYLEDNTAPRTISQHMLQSMYGLTDQESKVTMEMCHGDATLQEVAKVLEIHVNTARSHLKQVFLKTHTHSQLALIKMVLHNPALIINRGEAITPKDSRSFQLVRMISGRTVSYSEYGCLTGEPVLMCHPIAGSRLSVPQGDKVLKRLNIRLIVPDRPGYGYSSLSSQQNMDDWLEDMAYFIPQIAPLGCSVLAWSTGGVYATRLAIKYPELVHSLYLVGCDIPMLKRSEVHEFSPLKRILMNLASNDPKVACQMIKLGLDVAMLSLDSFMDCIADNVSESDQQILQDQQVRNVLSFAFQEGGRQGLDHMTSELIYMMCERLPQAGNIPCPVTIWHGEDDIQTPITQMKLFSHGLRQLGQANWVKGSGHYLIFSHWEQVLQNVKESLRTNQSGVSSRVMGGEQLCSQLGE